MFHFLIGLLPCCLLPWVCRLLPTCAQCGFPSTPPVASAAPLPLAGFPSTPHSVASPPPIPLGTTLGGCAALPTQLCLILMPFHHEPFGCFEDPRKSIPRLSAVAVGHNVVSTPSAKGECSVDSTVARNSLRSSTMRQCQVLKCPPGLGFSPPAIVPSITRTATQPCRPNVRGAGR